MLLLAGTTALMVARLDRQFDEEYGVEGGSRPLGLPNAMTRVGEFYDTVGTVPFTLAVTGTAALLGVTSGNDDLVVTAGVALEAVVFTKLFTGIGKRAIGRARPHLGEGPRSFEAFDLAGSSNRQSMPSGHTSSAFALASVFAARYPSPYIAIPLYGFAASVGMQRADSRSHWLSDILIGGTLGTLVGRALVRRHSRLPNSPVTLVPSALGSRMGAALVVRL